MLEQDGGAVTVGGVILWIINGLIVAVIGLGAYVINIFTGRVRTLEKTKADTSAVDEKFKTMVKSIDDKFEMVVDRLDNQDKSSSKRDDKLDKIVDSMASVRESIAGLKGNGRTRR